MTFNAKETSAWGGEPVELYEFTIETKKYRYTSARTVQTHNSAQYTPVTIKRSSVYQGSQRNKDTMVITVARDHPVALLFLSWAPAAIVQVTIYQFHVGESEYRVAWSGRVLGVSQKGGPKAEIHCEPISSSLRRYGLMRVTSIACPVVLYGVECGVNREAYSVEDTVSLISGNLVTVGAASAQPDGYYAGGFLKWLDSDGLKVYRTIMKHTGGVLDLIAPVYGLKLLNTVTIYPGCDKTWSACDTKFNNRLNYRGQRHLPLDINPMTGGKVF